MDKTVNLTPDPRILKVLGDIPFQPWQCLAELIDNAIDAFAKLKRAGAVIGEPKIDVIWSEDSVGSKDRVVEVVDNGPGMDIAAVTKAVTAGYTSNAPMGSLGLFGMGLNIATARLGDVTTFLSTRKGDKEWVGVKIDFEKLQQSGKFMAPIVTEPKDNAEESGTKVRVGLLKDGIYKILREKGRDIRKTLGDVYAPILSEGAIKIYVKGNLLKPRLYCVWASSRSVVYFKEKIFARIDIDRDLGSALFDTEKNQYLPGELDAEMRTKVEQGQALPSGYIMRPRRLRGWLGIQRFAHPDNFGIDFIRNGRKIRIRDKTLFSWDNPYTGESILEYPVELGSTQGGRIVGELHVDYLIPTYQKNDFFRTETAWAETVKAIRGDGPFLPKRRTEVGFLEKADSPLAKLVNAYRRMDPGTKCLSIPSNVAREWAGYFFQGNEDYAQDDKWWSAAVEQDREKAEGGPSVAPDVDEGASPSDNLDFYSPVPPTTTSEAEPATPAPSTAQPASTSTLDDLVRKSEKYVSLSGEYGYDGRRASLEVTAYQIKEGEFIYFDGLSVPCAFFNDADKCDYFFNPRHPLLQHYPLAARDFLTLYLSEILKARDRLPDLGVVFGKIYQVKFSDKKLDKTTLQDKAEKVIEDVREKMRTHLKSKAVEVLSTIHESSGEVEETVGRILNDSDLVSKFQTKTDSELKVLESVPARTLSRLLDKFPEEVMDEKVFKMFYMKLALPDAQSTNRARGEAKKRLLSFLEDVIALAGGSMSRPSKDELARAAFSLSFLEKLIVS